MQRLIAIIKNYWVFLLISALVISLIFTTLYFVFNRGDNEPTAQLIPVPQQKVPTQNNTTILLPVSQNNNYANASFTATFTNSLPATAPLYAKSTTGFSASLIQSVSSGFKITSQPRKIEDTYYWSEQGGNINLSVDEKNGFVNYTNRNLPPKPDSIDSVPMVLKPQDVLEGAKKLLINYQIDSSSIDLTSPTITYFTSYSEQPESTQEFKDTNIFMVSFPQKVGGKTLYKQYGEAIYTTVVFDRLYTVKQLNYFIFSVQKLPQTAPLITVDEFKKILVDKQGVIRQPFSPIDKVSSAEFNLTSATDGYLYDTTSPYLIPIFIATGTVILNNKEPQAAIIYSIASKN